MRTQFDSIHDSWNDFNRLPNQRVCAANVGQIVGPLIQNGAVRVLDLACGTGHYSRMCLDYGANEVIGVDISYYMLGTAVSTSRTEQYAVGNTLKFRVGDCREPRKWSGGNFDLVLGICMLDFARDQSEMTNMLRTVEMNLKPGGTFVGCQVRRSNNPASMIVMFDDDYSQKFGQSATVLEANEDGCRVRFAAHVKPIPIEFECYVLKSEITPKAVVASGLDVTSLDFPRIKVPDSVRDSSSSETFDKLYETERASFSLLTVKKKPSTKSLPPLRTHDLGSSVGHRQPSQRPETQYLNQKTWSHLVFGLMDSA